MAINEEIKLIKNRIFGIYAPFIKANKEELEEMEKQLCKLVKADYVSIHYYEMTGRIEIMASWNIQITEDKTENKKDK